MSKKDLKELLNRLTRNAIKVRTRYGAEALARSDWRFRIDHYAPSIGIQRDMRRQERYFAEVDATVAEIRRRNGADGEVATLATARESARRSTGERKVAA